MYGRQWKNLSSIGGAFSEKLEKRITELNALLEKAGEPYSRYASQIASESKNVVRIRTSESGEPLKATMKKLDNELKSAPLNIKDKQRARQLCGHILIVVDTENLKRLRTGQ